MSIVGRERDLLHFRKHRQKSPLTKRKGGGIKEKEKGLLENNSPKLVRNDFVQRDIPINYSMPSPLNSPLSFLPPPSLQSLFTSLSAYFTDKGISFLPLSSALRRAHERYSMCVLEGEEGGGRFFFLSIFRSVTCSQPSSSSSFFFSFYSVVRFRCCEVAFFPLFILLQFFDVDNRSGFPITMSIVLVSWRLKPVPGTNWKVWRGKWSVPFSTKAPETKASSRALLLHKISSDCLLEGAQSFFSPFFSPGFLSRLH